MLPVSSMSNVSRNSWQFFAVFPHEKSAMNVASMAPKGNSTEVETVNTVHAEFHCKCMGTLLFLSQMPYITESILKISHRSNEKFGSRRLWGGFVGNKPTCHEARSWIFADPLRYLEMPNSFKKLHVFYLYPQTNSLKVDFLVRNTNRISSYIL